MKVAFICAVFPPEPAPAGVMADELATKLVHDGHAVTMFVPFPNRPDGAIYPGYRRRLRSRAVSPHGYTLVHCGNWLIGEKRRFVDRILENITFGLSSAWAMSCEPRPDVIIIETWPLFAAWVSTYLARIRKTPYLYYVQDVYPEAAGEAGILSLQGRFARVCRALDRRICSRSATVVVISDTMQDLLSANRGLPKDHFRVIPNWVDGARFTPRDRNIFWRRSNRIQDDMFLALYAGTLGHASGVDILVEVARHLQAETDILLLCIGEGILKDAMLDKVSRLGLRNIRFLPFQASAQVPEIQASCEVSLLTTRQNASDASVPSKLITYLAAGRPVICAANQRSAVAQTLQKAKAGLVVPPGDALGIADAIIQLKCQNDTRLRMGMNARRCFEEFFTLERAHAQFDELIKETVAR